MPRRSPRKSQKRSKRLRQRRSRPVRASRTRKFRAATVKPGSTLGEWLTGVIRAQETGDAMHELQDGRKVHGYPLGPVNANTPDDITYTQSVRVITVTSPETTLENIRPVFESLVGPERLTDRVFIVLYIVPSWSMLLKITTITHIFKTMIVPICDQLFVLNRYAGLATVSTTNIYNRFLRSLAGKLSNIPDVPVFANCGEEECMMGPAGDTKRNFPFSDLATFIMRSKTYPVAIPKSGITRQYIMSHSDALSGEPKREKTIEHALEKVLI